MINTYGAIISACNVDGRLYKQVYKKNFILIAAIMGFSVIVLVLEILYSALNSAAYDIFTIVCFCALSVLGAFLLGLSLFAVKKCNLSQNSCECEIYQDCMIVSLYDKGEKISEVKSYYNNLFKSKETKNYFIAYTAKTSFYPISKDGLTPQEMNAVRKLLRLRILQGAGMAELPNFIEIHSHAQSEEIGE